MQRLWITVWVCFGAISIASSYGRVSYGEYSEAKKMAYSYLVGGLNEEDRRRFTPPPVPAHLAWAERNAQTIALMNATLKSGLYEVLSDEGLQEYWDACLYEIGVWSTVSPSADDFERVKSIVLQLEGGQFPPAEKLNLLSQGYFALGRIGTPEAKAFLRARMFRDFWGDQMPRFKSAVADSGHETLETAQTAAVQAYGIRGDDESISYLKTLAQKPEMKEAREVSAALRYEVDNAGDSKRIVEHDRGYYSLVRSVNRAAPNPAQDTSRAVGDSKSRRNWLFAAVIATALAISSLLIIKARARK